MYDPAANIKSIRIAKLELAKLETAIANALYSCDSYDMRELEKEIVNFTERFVNKGLSLFKDTNETLDDIDESYGEAALVEQADTIGAHALSLISDAI